MHVELNHVELALSYKLRKDRSSIWNFVVALERKVYHVCTVVQL